ncbi:Coiled-coil domain-containing protein 93-like protein [Diplonema papillatum]|nr:Coiled-coil domain-containing protein 93-like protein [Diplonema papillatum]KAJ9449424.1 Coiled-coil domain-containing protein 93-like protein [Diplonema papillatum]|eukprot:gene8613-13318_t
MSTRLRRGDNAKVSYEADRAQGIEKIVNLLVEGGYYRARISAIDTFDKIAGGLAWAIYCSRESIDVEFRENSNIRHKTKVGENIENALTAMQSKHGLQAYQITSLSDFPKLISVIEWLLKRVAAVRKEQEASIFRQGEFLFDREFGPRPADAAPEREATLPKRVLKRSPDEDLSTEVAHVSSVLLEYGHAYQIRTDLDMEAMEDEDQRAKDQLKKMQEEQERELKAMQEKMAQMASMKERTKFSSSAVGGLVAQQSAAIAQVSAAFEERMTSLREEATKDDAELAALKKREAQLQKKQSQLEQQRDAVRAIVAEREAAQAAADKVSKDLGKKERRTARIMEEIRKIEKSLKADPKKKELFNRIMKLLRQIEMVEEDAETLRAKRAAELSAWKKKLKKLEEKILEAHTMSEDEEVIAALQEQVQKVHGKLLPLIRIVADRDRDVAGVNRSIDKYPTRAELAQYEKRFTELYEQISWKYEETKSYYNMYNTLAEKQKNLQTEADLMKDIEQQITDILGPKQPNETKQALADGIKDVVEKVRTKQRKVADKLTEGQKQLRAKVDDHASHVSVQRSYLQAIKELQEEFSRNETLRNKIETMSVAVESAEAG